MVGKGIPNPSNRVFNESIHRLVYSAGRPAAPPALPHRRVGVSVLKVRSSLAARTDRYRAAVRLHMADLPGEASLKRKFEGEASQDYAVGEEVQYYCKHAKHWKACKVTKISREGITVSCRSTCIPRVQVKDRLRAPGQVHSAGEPVRRAGPFGRRAGSATENSAEQAGVTPVGELSRRSRGTFDAAFSDAGAKWLHSCKTVAGIFQKFRDSFGSASERRTLKDAIWKSFPGLADVSYQNFRGHPGDEDIKGHVHPCMLAFDPVAWDMFYVYEIDFLKELRTMASEGCAEAVLTLRPLAHVAVGDEEWSDFRWQPDGPYFCFVQVAVISFIVIVVSMQAELASVVPGMPQLVIPDWWRRDLRALLARSQHQGNSSERGMAAIKATLLLTGRHRALDPLMLHSVLKVAGVASEASVSDFLGKYNHRVRYDSDLIMSSHIATAQWNLMSPTRSGSLVPATTSRPPFESRQII